MNFAVIQVHSQCIFSLGTSAWDSWFQRAVKNTYSVHLLYLYWAQVIHYCDDNQHTLKTMKKKIDRDLSTIPLCPERFSNMIDSATKLQTVERAEFTT